MISKPTTTRRGILALVSAYLIAPLTAPVSFAADALGKVSDITGAAFAALGGKQRGLAMSSTVFLGDQVATSVDGRVSLLLAGKTTLRLGGSTKVTLDNFIANSGGVLTLGQGAIVFEGAANAFPKGVRIKSPYALIAVRGTKFYAGRLGPAFSVFVESGSVRVRGGGKSVVLRRGEGTDIAKRGDAPGPVKKWGPPKIKKFKGLFEE
ncbi:MAG: FecR domain-containing protein [Rhizobiales bacterium]|nr:FecR domain-containing protein [Hyphomicrobiales bacterium]